MKKLLLAGFILTILTVGCIKIVTKFQTTKEQNVPWHTVATKSVGRDYLLHIPAGYTATKKYPVVLNFHGGSGSPEGHMQTTNMNDTADKNNFIVVYPRGTRPDGNAKKQFLRFWNPGSNGQREFHNLNEFLASIDDTAYVDAIISDLTQNLSVDENKIYLTGFSNGGMLTHYLACHLHARIAGIASVSGPFWSDPQDCPNTNDVVALIMHGTADVCAPYSGGASECEAGLGGTDRQFISAQQSTDVWLKKNNCTEQFIEKKYDTITCNEYTNCRDKSKVSLCSISGGSHQWQNEGTPNTNELIWNFFNN